MLFVFFAQIRQILFLIFVLIVILLLLYIKFKNKHNFTCESNALWYPSPSGYINACSSYSFNEHLLNSINQWNKNRDVVNKNPNKYYMPSFSNLPRNRLVPFYSLYKNQIDSNFDKSMRIITPEKGYGNSNVFSIRVDRKGQPPLFVHNILSSMLLKAKNLERFFFKSCAGKNDGENDFPDVKVLNNINAERTFFSGDIYVECKKEAVSSVKHCPENTYFNGTLCDDNLNKCHNLFQNFKFSEKSLKKSEYFECEQNEKKQLVAVKKQCKFPQYFDGFNCVLHK